MKSVGIVSWVLSITFVWGNVPFTFGDESHQDYRHSGYKQEIAQGNDNRGSENPGQGNPDRNNPGLGNQDKGHPDEKNSGEGRKVRTGWDKNRKIPPTISEMSVEEMLLGAILLIGAAGVGIYLIRMKREYSNKADM